MRVKHDITEWMRIGKSYKFISQWNYGN